MREKSRKSYEEDREEVSRVTRSGGEQEANWKQKEELREGEACGALRQLAARQRHNLCNVKVGMCIGCRG